MTHRLPVVLVTCLLALTACGGGSSPDAAPTSTAPTSTAPTTTPAAAPTAITLPGAVIPLPAEWRSVSQASVEQLAGSTPAIQALADGFASGELRAVAATMTASGYTSLAEVRLVSGKGGLGAVAAARLKAARAIGPITDVKPIPTTVAGVEGVILTWERNDGETLSATEEYVVPDGKQTISILVTFPVSDAQRMLATVGDLVSGLRFTHS